jgi:uncharacterized protein (DUF1778 family)
MTQELKMTQGAPRITARVEPEIQELLSRAAALAGMASINAFVVSSAVEKAKKIIAEEELLSLSAEESREFFDALERPAKRHERLAKAFAKHR